MVQPPGPPGQRVPLSLFGRETVFLPGVGWDRGEFGGYGDRVITSAHQHRPNQGQNLLRARPRGRLQPPGQARGGLRKLGQGQGGHGWYTQEIKTAPQLSKLKTGWSRACSTAARTSSGGDSRSPRDRTRLMTLSRV